MNWIGKFLKLILAITFILILQIFVVNFLPYPFNHINIIFLSMLWLIILASDTGVLWFGIFILYISDLFTSLPFGINSSSMLISLVLIGWFLLNIFTNRSLYMVFLSSIIGLTFYRILFFIFLGIYNLITHDSVLPAKEVLMDVAWEIILSSIALLVFYFISSKFIRKLNPNYISTKEVTIQRGFKF